MLLLMSYYYFSIEYAICFPVYYQMLLLVQDHRDYIEVFEYLIQVMVQFEIINEDNVELYEQ